MWNNQKQQKKLFSPLSNLQTMLEKGATDKFRKPINATTSFKIRLTWWILLYRQEDFLQYADPT